MHDLETLKENYQQELLLLSKFLNRHEGIWSHEIIGNYPATMEAYSDAWLHDLSCLSDQEEWDLDCERNHHKLPQGELKDLLNEVTTLKAVPRMEENLVAALENQRYPSWALFQVSGKKQHEIKAISHYVSKLNLTNKTLVDIGGGKGHLSRILALYHGFSASSLDSNLELQELGKRRLAKYPLPNGHGELKFIHHTFGLNDSETLERENLLFKKSPFSVGLHTCGELALSHLQKSKLKNSLLNIGCCYQRLSPAQAAQLSHFSREKAPLELTKYALTLATRGHTDISLKDYTVKKRVKYYRAAIQLFANSKKGTNEFLSVGSNHPRDYFRSFSEYALEKMAGLDIKTSEDELESFYRCPSTTRSLDQIYRGNLVRWRFGRLIEKYLVYDRALKLIEEGHSARVFQIFDEKISPRNMAIAVN